MTEMLCSKTVAQSNSLFNIANFGFEKAGIFSKRYNKKLLLALSRKLHCPFVITDNALIFNNVDCFPTRPVDDKYVEDQKILILDIVKLFLKKDVKTVKSNKDAVGLALKEFVFNAVGSPLSAAFINDITDKNIKDIDPQAYVAMTNFSERTKIVIEKIRLTEDGEMRIIFSNYAQYSPSVERFILKRIKHADSGEKFTPEKLTEMDDDAKGFQNITGIGKFGVHTAAKEIKKIGHLSFSCQKDESKYAWYKYFITVDSKNVWHFDGLAGKPVELYGMSPKGTLITYN